MISALTRLSHSGVSEKSALGLSVPAVASATTSGSASTALIRGPREVSGGAKRGGSHAPRGQNFVGRRSWLALLRDGDERSGHTREGGPQVAPHGVRREPHDVVGHLADEDRR